MESIIYVRVSHANRSVSVQDQERECRAVCDRNGWNVRAVFCDDGISASRYGSERPAWEAMKSEVQAGDVLVVWEASRAGRDMAEYVALRDLCSSRNVLLSYSGRILDLSKGDDRFTTGLDMLVAERESELIRERVLRGKRSAAGAGRPSGRPPWGYRQKTEPKTGTPIPGVWELDPTESPRVREAVERFLRGESVVSILRWLKESGRSPTGATGLKRAITNPTIAGLRVHQGEVCGEGTWPPLITVEQHERVMQLVKGRQIHSGYISTPGPEPRHLLTGIAVCGVCGQGLEHKRFKRRSGAYVCPSGHVCRSAEPMDKAVEDEVLEMVAGADPRQFHTDDSPEVQRAVEEIQSIESTLQEWIEAAGRGDVTPSAFIKIEKDLRGRIAALKPKTVPAVDVVGLDYESLESRWKKGTVKQRRSVIRLLLDVKVMPYEVNKGKCSCGRPVYARSLCRPCYQRAWRGAIPMPGLVRDTAVRVVITRRF